MFLSEPRQLITAVAESRLLYYSIGLEGSPTVVGLQERKNAKAGHNTAYIANH
jgi:hypothetical protein